MGIGGSGMSAAASIAAFQKFTVSGCDLDPNSPYLKPLKKQKIKIYPGHGATHLAGVDILAISPAIPIQNSDHPEYTAGLAKTKVVTWQEFMGRFLHAGKSVLAVAGTHGKSTTTALLGYTLETAGLDPTVEVGASFKPWQSNYRTGRSRYFVSEADEFNRNFLSIHPEAAIINNVELDHPEYFHSEEDLKSSFLSFIKNLVGKKILVVNADSPLLFELITHSSALINDMGITCVSYRLRQKSLPAAEQEFIGIIGKQDQGGTSFSVNLGSRDSEIAYDRFRISLPGLHNVSNALGVIALSKLLDVPIIAVKNALLSFPGVDRRLEEIGEKSDIKVILDYAHHPTAVTVTLQAVKQKYPGRRIWAVFQPHMYSRLKSFLPQFAISLETPYKTLVLPVFASRDRDTLGVGSQDLVSQIPHNRAEYVSSFEKAASILSQHAKPGDLILVIGAGDIHKLPLLILEKL